MEEICGTCKAKTEYEYWNNIPETKHKFFKLMLGNFEHELRIPRKFAENFKGQLLSRCTLKGPSGNEWIVQVRSGEDDVLFSRGWEVFVRDHGIEVYDFLVFLYVGDSTFEVLVFAGSGCEREESYFAKRNFSEPCCGSDLHFERNHNAQMQQASLSRNNRSTVQRTRHNALYRGNYRVDRLPRCELIEDSDDLNVDDTDDDDDDVTDDIYNSEEEEEEEEEAKSFSNGPRRSKPRKQTQKCHFSSRREVTDEEKKRASTEAEDHLKRNKSKGVPMVGIIMLPTHVYKGFYLTIPKDWAKEYMIGKDHEVKLQVSGTDNFWRVGCRWTKVGQCQLRPRWQKFVLDNNLEEGDVCVFELVDTASMGRTIPVLKISIFRVVSEVAPLICKRVAV